MMVFRTALALACASALLPAAAPADDAETPEPARAEAQEELRFGQRARDWLELQRSGHAAGPPRSLDAEAALRARERYLRSFHHPIPDSFVGRDDRSAK